MEERSSSFNGEVGCKSNISLTSSKLSKIFNTTSMVNELSSAKSLERKKGTSAEKSFAIWAISISSVETITLSINLFSKATLIDQYINGFPQNSLIFFLVYL